MIMLYLKKNMSHYVKHSTILLYPMMITCLLHLLWLHLLRLELRKLLLVGHVARQQGVDGLPELFEAGAQVVQRAAAGLPNGVSTRNSSKKHPKIIRNHPKTL